VRIIWVEDDQERLGASYPTCQYCREAALLGALGKLTPLGRSTLLGALGSQLHSSAGKLWAAYPAHLASHQRLFDGTYRLCEG